MIREDGGFIQGLLFAISFQQGGAIPPQFFAVQDLICSLKFKDLQDN